MTRQKAIEEKCRECIYDELDEGTWRMQVEQCQLTDCALYQYRPQSRSKVSTLADSVAVQPHYEPMLVQVGVTP
jgi:hypothetical protein